MNNIEIKFKKIISEAKTPFKKFDVDAGFDLFATSIEKTDDYVEYKTGIAIEIPEGYVGLIFPRSSVTKYDLMLKNAVGVIDSSFRGEIRCRFARIPSTEFENLLMWRDDKKKKIKGRIEIVWNQEKQYEIGDRVAQIVFMEIPKITLVEVPELSETQRSEGGFGSTGK